MLARIPRLMVAATGSNVGKTSLTCGIIRALQRRGLKVAAFKNGPDYVDPLFFERVTGAPARNLDLFLLGEHGVRASLARNACGCDIAVIEGAMGYYDGIAASDEASSWSLAAATQTPTLLVIDGRGRALSAAAEVRGFLELRTPSNIAGVIANRCSDAFFPRMKQLIEEECGVAVAGYLPPLADVGFDSRHLGLVPASEIAGIDGKIDRLADAVEASLDMEALIALAQDAPAIDADAQALRFGNGGFGELAVAVAHDEAFCFYYADALFELEQRGCTIRRFSPLSDSALPKGVSGLYLGGGYPELHAAQLEANASMRRSVRKAVEAGMPAIAECGGFIYLHAFIEDSQSNRFSGVGVIEGTAFPTGRLGRFGYVTLRPRSDSMLFREGEAVRAHEFHYWDSDCAGADLTALKPRSDRFWECGHATPTMYAGFPHVNLCSDARLADRFVAACARYAKGVGV